MKARPFPFPFPFPFALASALSLASLAASLAGLDEATDDLALASHGALALWPRWAITVLFVVKCLSVAVALLAWYEGAPIGFELLTHLVSDAIRLAFAATPTKWHT
jgi:hypothetical protein